MKFDSAKTALLGQIYSLKPLCSGTEDESIRLFRTSLSFRVEQKIVPHSLIFDLPSLFDDLVSHNDCSWLDKSRAYSS